MHLRSTVSVFFMLPFFWRLPSGFLPGSQERTATGLLIAHNSAEIQQSHENSGTKESQTPLTDADKLFPVVEHGEWGYIDRTGRVVIRPQYHDAYAFCEGRGFVQVFAASDNHEGPVRRLALIDGSGNLNMHYLSSSIPCFSEGLAIVEDINGKGYGFMDKTGAIVIAPQFQAGERFSEGLA